MTTAPKTRRELIRELSERGLTGKEIAELLGCSDSNVSYHLRAIREEQSRGHAKAAKEASA